MIEQPVFVARRGEGCVVCQIARIIDSSEAQKITKLVAVWNGFADK